MRTGKKMCVCVLDVGWTGGEPEKQPLPPYTHAHQPPAFNETGAAVLSRLCQLEAQLYAACFSPSNSEDEEEEDTGRDRGSVPRPCRAGSQQYWEDGSLLELLRGLCSLLHERVRPLVIHEVGTYIYI